MQNILPKGDSERALPFPADSCKGKASKPQDMMEQSLLGLTGQTSLHSGPASTTET